jgi:cation diffusion facilitator family transporter
VGGVILIMKFIAAEMTHSSALQSDAIESMVNVAAAIFAFFAVLFADQPADADHPYGHGKVEHFSSVFEGGLIAVAALVIIFEAVSAFLHGPQIQSLNTGLVINFIAGTMNGLLGFYLIRNGKKYHSKALEADGHHVMSDFLTTLGIAGGLILAQVFNLPWLDPLLALGIGILLGLTGFKLVHESANALLDNADPGLLKKIVQSINELKGPELISVHELRTMRSGRYVHVDIHMVVPEFFTVEKAHELVESFGLKIIDQLKLEGEFHTHTDPCQKKYCPRCEINDCPIRISPYRDKNKLTIEEATSVFKTELIG